MNYFRIFYKYLCHFFSARHTRGFGVHSPFLFHFTRFVLGEKHSFYWFHSIENLRSALKKDHRVLNITDFGTGSDRKESVSKIANKTLQSAKCAQLMCRIVNRYKAENVLELGTSLGITTAYLSAVSSKIKCVSLEGCPEVAAVAKDNLRKLQLSNVEIVVGDIDETLPGVLDSMGRLDFVYMDANHRSESILKYFELCLSKMHKDTIVVVDDIYWSKDMEYAWEMIKNNPRVYATIDLFRIGIIFFNSNLHRKHYRMYW